MVRGKKSVVFQPDEQGKDGFGCDFEERTCKEHLILAQKNGEKDVKEHVTTLCRQQNTWSTHRLNPGQCLFKLPGLRPSPLPSASAQVHPVSTD